MKSSVNAILITAAISLAACAEAEEPVEVGPQGPICGPCDMTMPADYPLTEIAGMRFATCGEFCVELITANPERYAEFAVSE